MKKKLVVVLLMIILFNSLYIQPVYAQTSLIESIKQKATELSLIKLAVGAGATAITTYSSAKGLVKDMVASSPDVFNDYKDSVVDSANKLKFAMVAGDSVWQGVKSFFSSLDKPINEPFSYIPDSVYPMNSIVGLPLTVETIPVFDYTNYQNINYYSTHYRIYLDDIIVKEGKSGTYPYTNCYYDFSINNLSSLISSIQLNNSYSKTIKILDFIIPATNYRGVFHTSDINLEYSSETSTLSIGDVSVEITEPVSINENYYLDGQLYDTTGTITLDPRAVDPDDDFVNDNTGETPKRLIGFPLPWSELGSISEGVINDGIDLGELSNSQLEVIDLTLDALLNQVGSLTTDLVRTEDLLKEALYNPPIDTTGVIPAIESLGNILTNAFNPPTLSLDLTPLMNITILTDKFPFSIPWDLKNSIALLLDSPVPPIYEIPFNFGSINESFTLDFTIFDPIVGLFRWLITIAFTIVLIYFSTVFI